jgi:hypothetical protein
MSEGVIARPAQQAEAISINQLMRLRIEIASLRSYDR